MKEFLDHWMKTVEQMGAPWRQMAAGSPFRFSGTRVQTQMGFWFAAMRSTYEINSSWWKTLNEQTEEVFFKLFSESPAYTKRWKINCVNSGITSRKHNNFSMTRLSNNLRNGEAAQRTGILRPIVGYIGAI